ncbi:MAG: hypothetical protein JJLCMIEE_02590 [Acidimicrobiales bacterium]|nr:hypothetical protein [Acidimicrobiales bacterium]
MIVGDLLMIVLWSILGLLALSFLVCAGWVMLNKPGAEADNEREEFLAQRRHSSVAGRRAAKKSTEAA